MYSSLLSFVTLMFLPLGIKSRSVIWKQKQKQQHGNQIIRFKQQKGHNNHRNDGGTAIHYCWYQFIQKILRENKKDTLYKSLTMYTAIQSSQDTPTYDDAHSHTQAWWTVNHWSAVNNKRKMKIHCLPPPPPPQTPHPTILKKTKKWRHDWHTPLRSDPPPQRSGVQGLRGHSPWSTPWSWSTLNPAHTHTVYVITGDTTSYQWAKKSRRITSEQKV